MLWPWLTGSSALAEWQAREEERKRDEEKRRREERERSYSGYLDSDLPPPTYIQGHGAADATSGETEAHAKKSAGWAALGAGLSTWLQGYLRGDPGAAGAGIGASAEAYHSRLDRYQDERKQREAADLAQQQLALKQRDLDAELQRKADEEKAKRDAAEAAAQSKERLRDVIREEAGRDSPEAKAAAGMDGDNDLRLLLEHVLQRKRAPGEAAAKAEQEAAARRSLIAQGLINDPRADDAMRRQGLALQAQSHEDVVRQRKEEEDRRRIDDHRARLTRRVEEIKDDLIRMRAAHDWDFDPRTGKTRGPMTQADYEAILRVAKQRALAEMGPVPAAGAVDAVPAGATLHFDASGNLVQ